MATKPVFDEAQLKHYRDLFDSFDKDSSGAVDANELSAMCESLGMIVNPADIASMIEAADEDNSGQIEFDEVDAQRLERSSVASHARCAHALTTRPPHAVSGGDPPCGFRGRQRKKGRHLSRLARLPKSECRAADAVANRQGRSWACHRRRANRGVPHGRADGASVGRAARGSMAGAKNLRRVYCLLLRYSREYA